MLNRNLHQTRARGKPQIASPVCDWWWRGWFGWWLLHLQTGLVDTWINQQNDKTPRSTPVSPAAQWSCKVAFFCSLAIFDVTRKRNAKNAEFVDLPLLVRPGCCLLTTMQCNAMVWWMERNGLRHFGSDRNEMKNTSEKWAWNCVQMYLFLWCHAAATDGFSIRGEKERGRYQQQLLWKIASRGFGRCVEHKPVFS